MPELPEVEYARARLSRWAKGQRIELSRSFDELVVPDGDAFEALRGGQIDEVTRRGKNVLVEITSADGTARALWFHLGMTGHLEALPRSTGVDAAALPKFTRWALATPASVIALVDARRLGRAAAGPRAQIVEKHLGALGPEATEATAASLAAALDTVLPLKAALMDQARIAGLGNIHAAEALFLAKLHPERSSKTLSGEELARLATGIRAALARAKIDETAELAYVNEGGENIFFVYGREGEPCPVCSTSIVRDVQRGRSSYLCPSCQPAGKGDGASAKTSTKDAPPKKPLPKKAHAKKAPSEKAPAKKVPAKKAPAKKAPAKKPPAKKPSAKKRAR